MRVQGADDITPSSEATIFALKQAEEYWKQNFSIVAQLMPNCPLRNQNDIKKSFNAFINSDFSSQISCFKFGWMMPWWALELKENGTAKKFFQMPLKKKSRSARLILSNWCNLAC